MEVGGEGWHGIMVWVETENLYNVWIGQVIRFDHQKKRPTLCKFVD